MATYLTTPLPADLPSHTQGFEPSRDIDHQIENIAQHWLSQVELATATGNGQLFASLFVKNGFWRDILAFTNDYRSIRSANIANAATVSGKDEIWGLSSDHDSVGYFPSRGGQEFRFCYYSASPREPFPRRDLP